MLWTTFGQPGASMNVKGSHLRLATRRPLPITTPSHNHFSSVGALQPDHKWHCFSCLLNRRFDALLSRGIPCLTYRTPPALARNAACTAREQKARGLRKSAQWLSGAFSSHNRYRTCIALCALRTRSIKRATHHI